MTSPAFHVFHAVHNTFLRADTAKLLSRGIIEGASLVPVTVYKEIQGLACHRKKEVFSLELFCD